MTYITNENTITDICDSVRSATGSYESMSFPYGCINNLKSITTSYDYVPNLSSIGFSQSFLSYYLYTHRIYSIPNVLGSIITRIRPRAFEEDKYGGGSLSLENCKYIGDNAFYNCSDLTSIYIPNCSYIGKEAFWNCSRLTNFYIPNCEIIKDTAFGQCSQLRFNNIELSKCKRIEEYAFIKANSSGSFSGGSLFLPECRYIGYDAFLAANISTIGLEKCQLLAMSALYTMHLKSLYLLTSFVCKVENSYEKVVYSGTTVYVHSSLYQAYITDSYWKHLASQIVPYSWQ